MTAQTGQLLDSRGLTLDLAEGDLLESAVLAAKVIKPDGTVVIVTASTDGLDWITRRGLLAAANDIASSAATPIDEDDD